MIKQKKTRTRVSIYTPEIGKRIANYVRGGNYVNTAVAACGVGRSTFYEWMQKARQERERQAKGGAPTADAQYIELSDMIEQAQAEAEIRDIRIINAASKKYWQAAAWRLERKNPQKWGRKERLDMTSNGKTVNESSAVVRIIKLPDNERD